MLAACTSSRPLPTVDEVALDRYAGTWYDLAHLPQSFQKGCKCVTADYSQENGYVKVINTCVNQESGKTNEVKGKAFPVEGTGNSQLKVQFFWPFKGDYYIIALEDNYSYALVGSPDRESLWILSRRPEPAALLMKEYLNKAEELGFDTSKLEYTDQSCHAEPIQKNS
ncbi:MAG: lipocalin family protein [Owenweeksia sp.]|nr:lipocalin family protein [Owenweeksia sp.]